VRRRPLLPLMRSISALQFCCFCVWCSPIVHGRSQLDGWSASGGGALERRTPPSSSPCAEDRKQVHSPRQEVPACGRVCEPTLFLPPPQIQTTLAGPKPTTLASSFEAKPSMSPTRHSSYQPLASPSATSKPVMAPPLQHPSSVLVSSGPTATKAPSGKAPSQDGDSGHDHGGSDDDDDVRTPGHQETAKKPLTRAERRAIQVPSLPLSSPLVKQQTLNARIDGTLQEAQRAAKQARLGAQKSGQPAAPATKGSSKGASAGTAPSAPPHAAALSGASTFLSSSSVPQRSRASRNGANLDTLLALAAVTTRA
jgi:hypothetical protein